MYVLEPDFKETWIFFLTLFRFSWTFKVIKFIPFWRPPRIPNINLTFYECSKYLSLEH